MNQRTHQFCTFHVDNLFLGIDVQQAQEVIKYQEMTRVPLAPAAISGLINLRGQIVTALDLRRRLGLRLREEHDLPMNVIVRDGENAVSLLVDRIGDVVEVDDDLFEPPPLTLQADIRSLLLGAYKLPDRLLLVFDTARLLAENDARTNDEALCPT